MLGKKKKIIILAGMIALLVVTGVLNVYLNANADGGKITETGGSVYANFFDSFKGERQANRDQTEIYLQSIINNPASTEEKVAEAQTQLLEMAKHLTVETNLEPQIRALGYDNVAITSSNQKLTIILKVDELSKTEISTILKLALAESDKTPTDIRILPVK